MTPPLAPNREIPVIDSYRIVMMGTGTFAEPTLEALLLGADPIVGVFTQPDRDTGVKRASTRQVGRGMKEIAQEKGIAVFQPLDVNAAEGLQMLREVKPDLLVVAAYGQILSHDLLSIPTQGAINVHASLLPKYRGAAPIAWAIYHGETESGVTIIRISTGLDAGEMLAQESQTILPDETSGELEARLAPLGARMAMDVIGKMKLGPVSGVKQDPSKVTKAPKLKKEKGLVDWSKEASQVCRQVRAMQPWPTAYTYFHRAGKEPIRIIINRVKVASIQVPALPVGALIQQEQSLFVVTGNHSIIEVIELQPAGKKRMLAPEFLRGHRLQPQDLFAAE